VIIEGRGGQRAAKRRGGRGTGTAKAGGGKAWIGCGHGTVLLDDARVWEGIIRTTYVRMSGSQVRELVHFFKLSGDVRRGVPGLQGLDVGIYITTLSRIEHVAANLGLKPGFKESRSVICVEYMDGGD